MGNLCKSSVAVAVIILAMLFGSHSFQKSVGSVLVDAGIMSWDETPRVSVARSTVRVKGLSSNLTGLRVVQLSDFHQEAGHNDALIRESVRLANSLKPDVVLLTGDYINWSPYPHAQHLVQQHLVHLKARHGVFAVLGNHDYDHPGSKRAVRAALESIGILVLGNDATYPFEGEGLAIVGLGDLWHGDAKPSRAFRGVPETSPRIVLAHNPDTATKLTSYRADVIVSGHTHGGAVHLPLIGPVYPYIKALHVFLRDTLNLPKLARYMPYMNVIENSLWVQGLHTVPREDGSGEDNVLHVSRGVGSHVEKPRLLCDSQVELIVLISGDRTAVVEPWH